jgi:hypothetical protein
MTVEQRERQSEAKKSEGSMMNKTEGKMNELQITRDE